MKYLWILLLFVACTKPAAFTVVSPAQAQVPNAQGETLLSVQSKAGKTTSWSRNQLESLAQIEYSTPDPSQKNKVVRFQGVLLWDVLEKSGIANSSKLHLVALDKYEYTLDLVPLKDIPVMLSLSADGKPLTKKDFGPVYMVFPYHAYSLATARYDSAWVWQLIRLEER